MQEKELYKRRLEYLIRRLEFPPSSSSQPQIQQVPLLQLKYANELYEVKEATKRLELAIMKKELELLRQKQTVTHFGVFFKTEVNSLESARRLRATISMRHLIGDLLALNNSAL
jgi:hypothetical protein